MAWLTTNDGRHLNTEMFDADERKKYAQFEKAQEEAKKASAAEKSVKVQQSDGLSFLADNPKLENAVEKAFRKANSMAEPDIYKALYSYKAIRELDDEKIELLYEHLANRLFGANY